MQSGRVLFGSRVYCKYMEDNTGYLYAFKYGDISCTLSNKEPHVLCKLGIAIGWPTLMARFKNHQDATQRTFNVCPRIPRHGQRGSGVVPLFGKTFAESEGMLANIGGVEDIIQAMRDPDVDSRYQADDTGQERVLWPDLAYIVPMTPDLARSMESLLPWMLCTYIHTGLLRVGMDQQHARRYPTAKSAMSHRETFLMSVRTFDSLRELFLTGVLNSNTMTHLVTGRREAPSPEMEDVNVHWRDRDGHVHDMHLRYYLPVHRPDREHDEHSFGLLVRV